MPRQGFEPMETYAHVQCVPTALQMLIYVRNSNTFTYMRDLNTPRSTVFTLKYGGSVKVIC